MTLSGLAKYSMTRSVARSLCDSWTSCFVLLLATRHAGILLVLGRARLLNSLLISASHHRQVIFVVRLRYGMPAAMDRWRMARCYSVIYGTSVARKTNCFFWIRGYKRPRSVSIGWLRGTAVERWSLTGELSLSCARPAADRWPFMWVNRPL